MKLLKKFLVFLLVIIMLPIKVNAEQTDPQIVYKTTAQGTEGSGNWQYHPPAGETLYFVDDAAGIPNGGGYYFFKYGSGKFAALPQADLIALILNRGIGVTYNPNKFVAFVQAYLSQLPTQKGHLFTTGDVDLGICLNDISGCKYEAAPSNQSIDIPSTETNNVYNFYTYYIDHDGREYPAYINMPCQSSSNAKTACKYNTNWNSNAIETATARIDSTEFGAAALDKNTGLWSFPLSSFSNVQTITTNYESTFKTICDQYGLTAERHVVTWNEYLGTNTGSVMFKLYDSSDTLLSPLGISYNISNSGETTSNLTGQAVYIWINTGSSPNYVFTTNGGYKTVYPSLSQVGVIARNVYAPQSYQSNTYNEYNNQSENNNVQTTVNQIQNGGSSNETVYNTTKTTNNQYITNNTSNVDNSQIITNTTTTINNYYYGNNNDDPENPDNPSGGGGGGLEDDSILDALLAAILKLLRAIGKIIATILTGIIDIITEVLTAITNITTSFTGIIEFIGNIFGFLPAECLAVLTLGLTISVLIALIKMFGK